MEKPNLQNAMIDSLPETKRQIAETDIQYIKGIGPRKAEALQTVGIESALDLLYYFPRRYLDRTRILKIKDAQAALLMTEEVTFVGRIKSVYLSARGPRRMLFVSFTDGTATLKCVWFNAVHYFASVFKEGELIAFSGRVTSYRDRPCLIHPEYDHLETESDEDLLNTGGIIPVYPMTEALRTAGLESRSLRRIIRKLVESTERFEFPEDPLPKEVLSTNSLLGLTEALTLMHFPKDQKQLTYSLRRFKFEELFYLELLLAIRRNVIKNSPGIRMNPPAQLVEKFAKECLPFKFTESQRKSLHEIIDDMKSEHPMHRLLQGDVGSGKTVVALVAVLVAVENGYQAAFMAPTEILAAQQYDTIRKYFDILGVSSALLTGGQNKRLRSTIYSEIEDGTTSVVVGTHALIQERVKFKRLGFIVVDEQHRFGVEQRMALQEKGESPHLLVMTATPIPRTLSLTIYGDLDVSVIDEMPAGRKKIKTALRGETNRPKIYKFIRDQVLAGRQAFIVYPLVNETSDSGRVSSDGNLIPKASKKSGLKAATQGFVKLRDEVFRGFKVGLIHGQMTDAEKDDVMLAFKQRSLDVLVATTVIEVGIDVPNATVMLIEHADRFGLSQLHQLRGRIGRGIHQSYCILMADEEHLNEKKVQTRDDAAAFQRLKLFASTNDGFKIAEYDLMLRGPGEFFGTRQSGLPPLKLAHLIKDRDIITQARRAAFGIAESDPHLREEGHLKVRSVLLKNYNESLAFLKAT